MSGSNNRFLFVTTVSACPDNDGRTMKRIRQHVMRDIGLTRRKRRLAHDSDTNAQVDSETWTSSRKKLEGPSRSRKRIKEGTKRDSRRSKLEAVSSTDSSASPVCMRQPLHIHSPVSNIDINLGSAHLLDAIRYYDAACGINLRLYQDVSWFLSCIDATTHLCVQSLLATHIINQHPPAAASGSFLLGRLAAYNWALKNLRQKLSNPVSRYSDGVIASVAYSVCQAAMQRNLDVFRMHMQGLEILVSHRGGLHSISNLQLQELICYVGTTDASYENIAPIFPLPIQTGSSELELFLDSAPMPAMGATISPAWKTKIPLQTPLADILDDTILFLARMKTHAPRAWRLYESRVSVCVMILMHNIQSLCHSKILNINDSEDNIAECVRLAIHLSLVEPRRVVGAIAGYPGIYVSQLQVALSRENIDWTGLEELHLWCLFGGLRQSKSEAKRTWFQQQICDVVTQFSPSAQIHVLEDIDGLFF